VSETPKKLSLDAALREWPEAEKPAMHWEEMAQKIADRLQIGPTDAVAAENLLAEPLGQIEGEGHNSAAPVRTVPTARNTVAKGETKMTMPADRERDRRSLQDLAKMANSSGSLTPPPPSVKAPHASPSAPSGVQRAAEAKKDDSGIVDLAMAAQSDPQASVRAQTTPLASDGLFDDEPASVRPGPVSSSPVSAPLSMPLSMQQVQQPAPSLPPFSAPSIAPASAPASAAKVAVAATGTKKKGSGAVIALVFGGLVAASAIAAGGFFFVQHRAKAAVTAMSTPAAPPVVTAAAPVDPVPVAVAPEATVDPNALPSTPEPVALAPKTAPKTGAPAPLAMKDKPAPAPAPAKPEEGPKLSQKDLPPTPVGPEGDLNKGMAAAVGADGKPLQTPAAGNTGPQFAAGSVPQKPSQGAVTGAIGAVLPGARACLGPDDAVSRASITFTSGGAVQSVNVTGGAAGKPAEGCIKAALGKAKLAPFAEATYTANITVRH
jgi:hypothetical protein